MSDAPPDRLSNNPASAHYDPAVLERGVGVRFNGVETRYVCLDCGHTLIHSTGRFGKGWH